MEYKPETEGIVEVKRHKVVSYLKRARVVSESSPDEETQVGSILISQATGSVISEGYNGFIRGANDEKIPKKRPDKYDYMVHAEENLICNAARNGVRTDGCFVVQTLSPCQGCARRLYQSGITRVYCQELYHGTVLSDLDITLEVNMPPEGGYYIIDIKATENP